MKTYALFLVVNILAFQGTEGKIRNGYEVEITTARQAFETMTTLLCLDSTMSSERRIAIQGHLKRLKEFFAFHQLTETLLMQFKQISPDIYQQIDTVTDALRRPIDVYVRFLPPEKARGGVMAVTNIPTGDDENTYSSRYGRHTVAICVIISKNALNLLAHEFGHVSYQVKNIAEYRSFYKKYYREGPIGSAPVGHHLRDLSGREALNIEKSFHHRLSAFVKLHSKDYKNPLRLKEELMRKLWLTTN